MKKRLSRRGSVLLLVVVLLAVIGLLAAAAVSFSQAELGAARNERSGDELLACADAGRQYMLSRFNMFQSVPESIEPVNVDLTAVGEVNCAGDGTVKKDSRCARSGHIGQIAIKGVTAVEAKAGGRRRDLKELTNSVGRTGFGGTPHKITVHCVDENGRGTEVEFVVRFGL